LEQAKVLTLVVMLGQEMAALVLSYLLLSKEQVLVAQLA
jgi:hypothetical protein